MRVALFSFLIVMHLENAFSQCNINTYGEEDNIFVAHAQESIFEYVDSQGGVMMFFEFAVSIDKQTKKVGALIVIESSAVGGYTLIVPRTMTFYFSDNTKMVLEANSLSDLEYDKGVTSQRALFFIMGDQRKILGSTDVKQITISDPRKNKEIRCNPYKALIKEQVNCVLNNL